MTSFLSKIGNDYKNAEISCLFLHDRRANKNYNLFTIIELIPYEQESSMLINDQFPHLDRRNKGLNGDFTVYIGRTIDVSVENAVEIFEDINNGFELNYENSLKAPISIFDGSKLEYEPPGYFPLLIDTASEDNLAAILPKHHTSQRLWTRIDTKQEWKKHFDEKQIKAILLNATQLTSKYFGFDIAEMPEHLGNIYLTACNPIIRSYESSLVGDKDLLISFYERKEKSVQGCKLILEEKRGAQTGFSFEKIVEGNFTKIELPYLPHQLVTKLFDSEGQLLENNTGMWINFAIAGHISHTELNVTIAGSDGVETIKVAKHSGERPFQVGNRDFSHAHYFTDHYRSRSFIKLEKSKEFIFFPGSNDDKIRAKAIINELLNRASKRCILLDPYFGAADVGYAMVVENVSVPIQIISSASFLSKKISKEPNALTNAEQLADILLQFKKIYSAQKIDCRVLVGNNKSPLHDRYIVVDDNAYLLGSSFNEFGTRATILAKVPAPIVMINQAEDWWNDSNKILSLDDFINSSIRKNDAG